MRGIYLGIDAGSTTIKVVGARADGSVVASCYMQSGCDTLGSLALALSEFQKRLDGPREVEGVGVTGSGRELASVVVGADLVKNEITAHAFATLSLLPEVRTIIEIGGQESKIIILKDGMVVDFGLNSVCAAGTGSFLDHQAARMGITVEQLGRLAASSRSRAHISGRCVVFAQTDMIQKQHLGYSRAEICAGLCDALVANFITNVARGKPLDAPVAFQGGVAANMGMREAFARHLGCQVVVPQHYALMGAIGVAQLAARRREWDRSGFKGFDACAYIQRGRAFVCHGCENRCEIVELERHGRPIGYLGSRCGKWAVPPKA